MEELNFDLSSLTREEHFPFLSPPEWRALQRMSTKNGEMTVKMLLRTNNEPAIKIAVSEFTEHEVNEALAQLSTRPALAPQPPRTPILKLDVTKYAGDDKVSLRCWYYELTEAIRARQITTDDLQVSFAISTLAGRAKAWAVGCRMADEFVFPSVYSLKEQLQANYEPPHSDFRLRTEFFHLRQGTRDIHEYIEHIRHLQSSITGEPLGPASEVAAYMNGLREGLVRTQLYREYPSTLAEAFKISLREDYSARQAKTAVRSRTTFDSGRSEPMEVSVVQSHAHDIYSDGHDSDAQAHRVSDDRSKDQRETRTCHRCGKAGHLARECRAAAPMAGISHRSNDNGRSGRGDAKNGRHQ